MTAPRLEPLSHRQTWRFAAGAVVCFHAAYTVAALGPLILVYVICLGQLARLARPLHAFAAGLLVGVASVAPQLAFFYGIFGPPAITLWVILAGWIAAFVAALHFARARWGPGWAALLAPFLWLGLEYFRSEVYFLRFSWLNVGYALGPLAAFAPFHTLGVYGVGFAAAALAGWVLAGAPKPWAAVALALALLGAEALSRRGPGPARTLEVAGVQMEFPSRQAVLENLDRLAGRYPRAPLYVLSEYTFDGPVPGAVKAWCRAHGKYLIAGGKEPGPGNRYRNTAYVVGPGGEIVFSQAKSVPIQFFDDGLPAGGQQLWASPWGKIGLCICYDLSYQRVTGRLAKLGAQALIVPTMDAENWGAHEHALHTRVAPVRAAEYGIPVFRVASSGVSQAIDAQGHETARAPYPGEGAMLGATLELRAARW